MNDKTNTVIKPGRGRPKTLNKQQVIDTAMQAYWQEGIRDVSINEICKRCQISKPGMYREFGNEDGLMQSVILHYQELVQAPIIAMLESSNDFIATLNLLIDFACGGSNDNTQAKGCLLVKIDESRLTLGTKTLTQLKTAKAQRIAAYTDWLDKAKQKGEIQLQINAEFAAKYLDAQLSHAMSQIARGYTQSEVEPLLRLALSLFNSTENSND